MTRSYPSTHDASRAAWAPSVAAGSVHCRRGDTCRLKPQRDSTLIRPDDEWDLGHPDLVCPKPTAPEHLACNRATATWKAQAGRRQPEVHPARRALQRGV